MPHLSSISEGRVGCLIMANSTLSQSSQDVLRRLDEQLKECTPLDECPGEQGHGLDYAVRVEEARKVNNVTCTWRPLPDGLVLGHSLVSELSQVHAGGRVVRTMGLWLIELRQEEEVLKLYHKCMVSMQTTACQIISASYELLKYTGRSTECRMTNWEYSIHHVQQGNELEIEILRVLWWLNTCNFTSSFLWISL